MIFKYKWNDPCIRLDSCEKLRKEVEKPPSNEVERGHPKNQLLIDFFRTFDQEYFSTLSFSQDSIYSLG